MRNFEHLKSWNDLAKHYNLFLFNNVTDINDGKVLEDWMENHQCDAQEAGSHVDGCEVKDCAKCKEYKEEYGKYPSCECQPYQWYLISIDTEDAQELNKEFHLDIFYSETIDQFVLPVYHYGTSWRIMGLRGGYVNL